MTNNDIQNSLIRSIRARLDRPVVMIGLMGAGKSRTGKMLADALSLPFTDADDEVEAAAGMKIADIFEKYGEPAFREGEAKVMKRLIEQFTDRYDFVIFDAPTLLGTADGTVLNRMTDGNIRALLSPCGKWNRAPSG